MTASRVIALLVATMFLVATAAPASAQAKPAEVRSGETTKDAKANAGTTDKAEKKAAKKAQKAEKKQAKKAEKAEKKQGKQHDTDDPERSNKGGAARGLDRADKVAGEHGKPGRDNARTKQAR